MDLIALAVPLFLIALLVMKSELIDAQFFGPVWAATILYSLVYATACA
jgi:hypothetical protein